jgi:hypothetical protein
MAKVELRDDHHPWAMDVFEPVGFALIVETMHDRRQLVAAGACVLACEMMARPGSVSTLGPRHLVRDGDGWSVTGRRKRNEDRQWSRDTMFNSGEGCLDDGVHSDVHGYLLG